MSKLLKESTSAPVKSQNGRWRVIVATPGQGSSGFYSEELLRTQGPSALHPGAQSFINHDGDRNPKDMIGTFPEGGKWDEEKKALVAELEVFPHWREFVESVGPACGMSIYFHGDADDEGQVTSLIPHPGNGCDLVARPGLAGSGLDEKLYESARARAESKLSGEDDTNMDMTEVLERLDALTQAVAPLVEAHAAEVKAQETHKDEMTAVERYDEAIKAIEAADLFPSQVEDLRARALKGEDIAEAIESAQAIKKDAVAQIEEARVQQESATGGRLLGGVKVESALDLGKVLS